MWMPNPYLLLSNPCDFILLHSALNAVTDYQKTTTHPCSSSAFSKEYLQKNLFQCYPGHHPLLQLPEKEKISKKSIHLKKNFVMSFVNPKKKKSFLGSYHHIPIDFTNWKETVHTQKRKKQQQGFYLCPGQGLQRTTLIPEKIDYFKCWISLKKYIHYNRQSPANKQEMCMWNVCLQEKRKIGTFLLKRFQAVFFSNLRCLSNMFLCLSHSNFKGQSS